MPNVDEVLRQALTGEQYEAAVDPASEILCLACAGSGKSRTLAYRIARLIAQGADPKTIVAFTFTEKAAESIKRRVAEALSSTELDPTILGALFIGTIHGYCQNVLGQIDARYRQYDVLDTNRFKLYLISRWPTLNLAQIQARLTAQSAGQSTQYFKTIKKVSDAWSTLNDEMIDMQDVISSDPVLGDVLRQIGDGLDRDQYIDFSLMVRRVVDAINTRHSSVDAITQVRHLMVDEYQDVNPAQEALIRAIHPFLRTLFVVGDDDQSIYAWRGADVHNILTFQTRYPQCSLRTLSHNFRSTEAIVQTSAQFAAAELGATRISKSPTAVTGESPRDFRVVRFTNRQEEAAWVSRQIRALLGTSYKERDGRVRGLTPGDFAILMRSTRQPESTGEPRHTAFTDALQQAGIPYSLESGGSVFDRPQVAALRDTFELLRNQSPSRETVSTLFTTTILQAFPMADFDALTQTLAEWGRLIHSPSGGARRRVFPQMLVYQLLEAFHLADSHFDEGTMQDIGMFSRMIQDVETVYLSIDSATRFREILNFLQNVAETGYDRGTDDVVRQPDAVSVSTVHKVKGLEFPVVFIVDVEGQRFPKRNQRYDGLLPNTVIGPALSRGAYQSTPDEEARLFYTALTRAERYLYVTSSQWLPNGQRAAQQSRFALRLVHPDISNDPDGIPAGLTHSVPRQRVDESIVPTTFSEIRYFLACPYNYKLRKTFGFSPAIREMFGFGQTVHTGIEKLHELFPNSPPSIEDVRNVVDDIFHLKHVPQSRDPVNRPGGYERAKAAATEMTENYVQQYSDDFVRLRQIEARFEIPVAHAVITGAIDLVLRMDEEGDILDATVVDFKAMEGGNDPEQNPKLEWTDLALQVQLYAKAATEVLGESTKTGSVHLLKDNQRVEVPVSPQALEAAIKNVEWAVDRIIDEDYPMRPETEKCASCDFRLICSKHSQDFYTDEVPPPLHVPNGYEMIGAFSRFR